MSSAPSFSPTPQDTTSALSASVGVGAPRNRWAIVLAGGDGTRLLPITRRLYGYDRPKQFCAFDRNGTLLEQTLHRARRLVDPDRIVVVVGRHQWREALQCLAGWPEVRIIDQPANRGTLPGILWPVLNIEAEDPEATVLIMPSDHHVGHQGGGDDAMAEILGEAARMVGQHPDQVVLLGAHGDGVPEGVGWIVPDPAQDGSPSRVRAFHEKPSRADAQRLHGQGALVSTFIMAARAHALSEVARQRAPNWWGALKTALREPTILARVYDDLAPAAFSEDILVPAVEHLRVLPLDGVQWSDIGTPQRLQDALAARPDDPVQPPHHATTTTAWEQDVWVVR